MSETDKKAMEVSKKILDFLFKRRGAKVEPALSLVEDVSHIINATYTPEPTEPNESNELCPHCGEELPATDATSPPAWVIKAVEKMVHLGILRYSHKPSATRIFAEAAPKIEAKTFPIQRAIKMDGRVIQYPRRIPWSVAELAYGPYSTRYGDRQSLETLAERGGFGPEEMDSFVPDWRNRCCEIIRLQATQDEVVKVLGEYLDTFVCDVVRRTGDQLKPDCTCESCKRYDTATILRIKLIRASS